MTWRAIAALAIALAACGRHAKPRSTTTLVLDVTDAGKPVGARVLLFDAHDQPVRIGHPDVGAASLEVRRRVAQRPLERRDRGRRIGSIQHQLAFAHRKRVAIPGGLGELGAAAQQAQCLFVVECLSLRARRLEVGPRCRLVFGAVQVLGPQHCVRVTEPGRGLPMQIAPELDEIDFGDWTGKSYEELARLPEWRAFNLLHSSTRIPNGELLLEAQSRVVGFMGQLSERYPDQTIALVSHGDVIRVALAHQLGIPIDFIMRFEIAPASVSAVEIYAEGPRVMWVNHLAEQI